MALIIPRELPAYEDILSIAKQMPEVEPSAVRATLLIARCFSEASASFERFFAKHHLSEGRFALMMQLYKEKRQAKKKGLSPAGLSQRLGVTRATITGLLDRLERDGHIVRSHRKDDRRMVLVEITDKGIRLLEQVLPAHFRRVSHMFSRLGEQDRTQLVELVARLREGLSEIERA